MSMIATSRVEEPCHDVAVWTAKQEIANAWDRYRQSVIKHFKDGLEFGRACHQWQAKYKAQGSRSGKGFEQLLAELEIPKTTAYRWIRRYEVKYRLRADRHEVRAPLADGLNNTPTPIQSAKERTEFVFFLTHQEREEFRQDVKTLGGERKVAAMFLEFISQKACEKRAVIGVGRKVSPHNGNIKRLAVGA